MAPGPNTTSSTVFTRGSHKDDVIRLQGPPAAAFNLGGAELWWFFSSSVRFCIDKVTFSCESDTVVEWDNESGELKVSDQADSPDPGNRREPDADEPPDSPDPYFFGLGSHKDDVVRLQGSPIGIEIKSKEESEVWCYNPDTTYVELSIHSGRVTGWTDLLSTLKVQRAPGSHTTFSSHFVRGSHKDDVIRLQGWPLKVRAHTSGNAITEVWFYGIEAERDLVIFNSDCVDGWTNASGQLKVLDQADSPNTGNGGEHNGGGSSTDDRGPRDEPDIGSTPPTYNVGEEIPIPKRPDTGSKEEQPDSDDSTAGDGDLSEQPSAAEQANGGASSTSSVDPEELPGDDSDGAKSNRHCGCWLVILVVIIGLIAAGIAGIRYLI